MKSLEKYLKKRDKAIQLILKPGHRFSPANFLTLRVEIKKLAAFFDLINAADKDFKKKKIFKPFKILFDQAGKIREFQLEMDTLNKYFPEPALHEYRKQLNDDRLKVIHDFIAILDQKFLSKMDLNYSDLNRFFPGKGCTNVKSYLKKKRKQIKKILLKPDLQPEHLHALRKLIKAYRNNQKSLNKKKKNAIQAEHNLLPDLLGKWHDGRVILRHLEKVIRNDQVAAKEEKQLQKIKKKITAETEQLFGEITRVIPGSAFVLQ